MTRGYWNRPDETAATYIGEGTRWLRTGDLGMLQEGELTVTGRLKDLLIVRGAKHFPQDLERTAERTSPHLRRGAIAAVSIADDVRGDRIVLVAELEVRQPEPGPLEEALVRVRQATADEHGIQLHGVALVPAGTLPRTTSGKLQRFRVRDAWTAGTLGPVAVWSAG